jgi:hypothetical protein
MIADILFRPGLAVGAALIALAAFLYRRIKLFVQLRHVKGPLVSRVTGIPHMQALLSEDCHNWYSRLNEEYGIS